MAKEEQAGSAEGRKAGGQYLGFNARQDDWAKVIGIKHGMEVAEGRCVTITDVMRMLIDYFCLAPVGERVEAYKIRLAASKAPQLGCGTCYGVPAGNWCRCVYCGNEMADDIASRDLVASCDAEMIAPPPPPAEVNAQEDDKPRKKKNKRS